MKENQNQDGTERGADEATESQSNNTKLPSPNVTVTEKKPAQSSKVPDTRGW